MTHELEPANKPTSKPTSAVERWLEQFLFASRWLLAPIYVTLVIGLVGLLVKVVHTIVEFIPHVWSASESRVILDILGLIDLSLTGSLVVIVIFSGYENFVSKIDPARHSDWPEWMTKIDFAGLKLKVMSSIVAISAIQLLRAFMDLQNYSDRDLAWYVGIHLTFVVSALLLAWTDRMSAEQH